MQSCIVNIQGVEFSVDYTITPQEEGFPAEIELRSVEPMDAPELREFLAEWVLQQIEDEILEEADE